MPAKNDNYETPSYLADWAIKCVLYHLNPFEHEKFNLLEPGCGARAPFANAGIKYNGDVVAMDNRLVLPNSHPFGELKSGEKIFHQGTNFLDRNKVSEIGLEYNSFDVIATNPPFSKAEQFIWESFKYLKPMGIMIFLLKLPFLSSLKRMKLYSERPPYEVWVLQRRPSFSYNGKTDMTEYGFYIWLGETLDRSYRRYNPHTLLKWLDNKELEKEFINV